MIRKERKRLKRFESKFTTDELNLLTDGIDLNVFLNENGIDQFSQLRDEDFSRIWEFKPKSYFTDVDADTWYHLFYNMRVGMDNLRHKKELSVIEYHYGKNYGRYTGSKSWKEKRKMRFKLSEYDGKCEVCFKKPAWSMHHLTYERVGNELMEDLQPICGTCHKTEHGK